MAEEFEDKVIFIRRTAKTYQGGRRFRFGAMVAIGDRNGRVGVGLGKAKEVPIAVQKGQYVARRNLIEVPIEEPGTIPHEVLGTHSTSRVMLKPAGAGTGVIAGSVPRAIVELAGFRNLLTKEIGSRNQTNVAYAVIDGLKQLKTYEESKARTVGRPVRATLVRSLIGVKEDQKATVRALGFKKTGDTRELKDTPDVRGMVNKVSYLLKVEG